MIPLTEKELELMQVLWSIGEANVKSILSQLPQTKDAAYTTVSTQMRILVRKGFCEAVAIGRGHVYRPTIEREEYEQAFVGKVVESLFQGDAPSLVKRLVQSQSLTAEQKDEILNLLDSES